MSRLGENCNGQPSLVPMQIQLFANLSFVNLLSQSPSRFLGANTLRPSRFCFLIGGAGALNVRRDAVFAVKYKQLNACCGAS